MKPIECRETIEKYQKWDNMRYQLMQIISKGRSPNAINGSGSYVFKVQDR